jgi:cell fate regulator YaaT (PSP1 superfamily)
MATAVSVAFKRAGKAYDFDADGAPIEVGDLVVVRTTRGMEIGEAVSVHESEDPSLKKVIRKANDDDVASLEENKRREGEARRVASRRASEAGLAMKVVDVEVVFDRSKTIIAFTAEDRVDFRDLVKDLSGELSTRVEMKQIGVRDEAKIIGGLGPCGQRLCCSVFAGDFEPVSIRMAKEQDLPLNPQKISGVCGRLMCCLKYEYEAYKDFKGRAPKKGSVIDTPHGSGKVVELQTPRERVVVSLEEGGRVTIPLCEVGCKQCAAKASEEAQGLGKLGAVQPARPERPRRGGSTKPQGAPASERSSRRGRGKRGAGAEGQADTAKRAAGEGGQTQGGTRAAGEGGTRRPRSAQAKSGQPKAEQQAEGGQAAAGRPAEGDPTAKRRRRRRRRRSGGGTGAAESD